MQWTSHSQTSGLRGVVCARRLVVCIQFRSSVRVIYSSRNNIQTLGTIYSSRSCEKFTALYYYSYYPYYLIRLLLLLYFSTLALQQSSLRPTSRAELVIAYASLRLGIFTTISSSSKGKNILYLYILVIRAYQLVKLVSYIYSRNI